MTSSEPAINLRITLYVVMFLIVVVVAIGAWRWQDTHHQSADQSILIEKSNQH